ncbi:DNA polymerase III subunit beta [Fibrella aestuarina BUZ 2]|uniref:Beta sliding clamp n=1 Tax=Fibrella aestuarina BUZ 2 TaxID=1166018 RepID=I0KAY5_9BACT|nr:DNA polymerase III subunit beta [Fibrella aestuarina]CCH01288.1 DNA polymerase III subunit beta [Fibrella aestuarina BUZ 2]
MKFIVSSSVLLKNLLNLSGVIAATPIVPVLENVLLRIEDGLITVTASDLQLTMTVQVPVDASADGSVCIPAKLLLDVLKSLPEQPITIHINAKTFATEILTDNGRFKLSGQNPIDYPKLPKVAAITTVELPSGTLLDAITHTAFACSNDDLKAAQTGVYALFAPSGTTFYATDGHKLARYTRTDVQALTESSFIIPRKAMAQLKTALSEGVPVTLEANQSHASFSFGSTQLITRLIDEVYPGVEAMIPTTNTNDLVIGRADLVNSLKRTMICANRTTHQIRLSLKKNTLTISAEDLDYANEASEVLLCEYEGDDMEIGFNAKILTDLATTLSAKMVTLSMSTSNRPALLTPVDKDEHEAILMLIMPLQLNV